MRDDGCGSSMIGELRKPGRGGQNTDSGTGQNTGQNMGQSAGQSKGGGGAIDEM